MSEILQTSDVIGSNFHPGNIYTGRGKTAVRGKGEGGRAGEGEVCTVTDHRVRPSSNYHVDRGYPTSIYSTLYSLLFVNFKRRLRTSDLTEVLYLHSTEPMSDPSSSPNCLLARLPGPRNRISSAMTHPLSSPKLHNSPSPLFSPSSSSDHPSLPCSPTIPFLALLSRKPKMRVRTFNTERLKTLFTRLQKNVFQCCEKPENSG